MLSTETKYHASFVIDNIQFTVIATESGIRNIIFNSEDTDNLSEKYRVNPNDPRLHSAYFQLQEYFNRERRKFNLPLEIEGTEFQKSVWHELLKIPFGQTISYQTLAIRLGDKKLIRAVANANGLNPVPIVIPCHRVIGADGSMVGYGGGIELKEKLLTLEGSRTMELFNLE
ncbi:MAG: methylated-DNA--[protein]-cysteine S-methyltransferase [Ignavibacterium sp.]|nr:MAG: methylated-DNA--[protein]-cysteine S-methyltransferase [Ignavibacterium sp.]